MTKTKDEGVRLLAYGPSGSGKTQLLEHILDHLRSIGVFSDDIGEQSDGSELLRVDLDATTFQEKVLAYRQRNTDIARAVNDASIEIKHLRKTLDALAPKAEAYDNLVAVIRAMKREGGYAMAPDIVPTLDHIVADLLGTRKPKD